ncbi:MAG: SAV_2336 N-terminal domain-related protein, partial [Blastocatellia bacterium]
MLSELIKTLDQADTGLDHLQLAEALWLAQFAPRVEILPELTPLPKREDAEEQPKPDQAGTADSPQSPKPQSSKKLHAKSQAAGAATRSARAVAVPDVAALPDALAVGRAMRPLRRRAASRWNWRLDEEATAEASAEASAPGFMNVVPVMRPAQERWFDLELVVEQSVSMAVWRDAARELQRLLEHLGAFGDVRRWTLFRRDDRAGLLDAAGREHSTRALCDSFKRRLVMVFSDGSSRGWMNGAFATAIAGWSGNAAVVLVQPLGERLWGRTLVGDAIAEITSPEPGAANSKLRQTSDWSEPNGKQIALPVVSLNPEMISRWARMVALPGNTFRAALLDAARPVEPASKSETPITERLTRQGKRAGMLWQLREWIAPTSSPIEPPTQLAPSKTVSPSE